LQTLLLQAATAVDLEVFQQLLNTVAIQTSKPEEVPYTKSIERIAMEEGIQLGILTNARKTAIEALKLRFGSVPNLMVERINHLKDEAVLESLLEQAITAVSLETFQQLQATVAN